jgi:hypothetical protein
VRYHHEARRYSVGERVWRMITTLVERDTIVVATAVVVVVSRSRAARPVAPAASLACGAPGRRSARGSSCRWVPAHESAMWRPHVSELDGADHAARRARPAVDARARGRGCRVPDLLAGTWGSPSRAGTTASTRRSRRGCARSPSHAVVVYRRARVRLARRAAGARPSRRRVGEAVRPGRITEPTCCAPPGARRVRGARDVRRAPRPLPRPPRPPRRRRLPHRPPDGDTASTRGPA